MARLPKKIDRRWATRNDACPGETDNFLGDFPGGLTVTLENLLKATDAGHPISWLGGYLLPDKAYGQARASAIRLKTQRGVRRNWAQAIWAEYVRQGVNQGGTP